MARSQGVRGVNSHSTIASQSSALNTARHRQPIGRKPQPSCLVSPVAGACYTVILAGFLGGS